MKSFKRLYEELDDVRQSIRYAKQMGLALPLVALLEKEQAIRDEIRSRSEEDAQ